MLNALTINAFMLIGLISMAYLTYHTRRDYLGRHPLVAKILLGVFAGASGILLMNQSFHSGSGIFIDYRNFTIGISAIFGGLVSVSITSVLIFIYRLIVTESDQVKLLLFVALVVLTLGSALIAKFSQKLLHKWIYCCLLNFSVSAVSFYILLDHDTFPALLYIYFYCGNILLAAVIYLILRRYIQINDKYMQLTDESTTDFLTEINNVRGFDAAFNKAINWTKRRDERLSFLMIDIDHFKRANDTHGHLAGDEILRQLALVLAETSRSFDVVSRNGGEEFSVILQDCPLGHAQEVAERIRRAVENKEFIVGQKKIKITVSIGVASFPDHTDNPEVLLKLSDKALYEAKQAGRNRVCVYSGIKADSESRV